MKSCAGRELARPLLQRGKPGSGHPKIICFIQSDAIKHSHNWVQRVQHQGRKDTRGFSGVQINPFCLSSGLFQKRLQLCFYSLENWWTAPVNSPRPYQQFCRVSRLFPVLFVAVEGSWGKRPTEELLLNIFLSPPPPECRLEADAATLEQSSRHRHICWVIKNTAFKTAAFILIYFWPECDFISSAEILCLFSLFVCHVLFFLWSTL